MMVDILRACLFDAAGLENPSLRTPFEQVPGFEILAETSTWDELLEWIRHRATDVVAVNLDDEAGLGFNVVEQVAQLSPTCAILGVSGRTDPETIIGAMRSGCNQFVSWPVDMEDLSRAIERIRATQRTVPHASQRVCVIGSAGGVGATTIACNLAMEFAHLSDRRTALVDMNLEFGDVACSLDCKPKYSIADVCREGVESDHMMLEKAIHELPSNVAIMARPDRIEDARVVSPEGVQNMLRVMSELYPFVVIDLPRTFSFLSAAAVAEADRLLIVTQLNVPTIRNATRIYDCLMQMNAKEDRIEIVLNRCKASYERIAPDEVEAHFRRPIFAMVPNDYRRVQSSLDLGHPVMTDAPNSPARLAIHQMAKTITTGGKTGNDSAPSAARKGGIFQRWLGGTKPPTGVTS